MPLVPAICTQCGAPLEVNPLKDAAVCPYCRTSFVTEKAINNYNTTNVTQIKNLQTDAIILNDTTSIDNRVRAGETFIKLGNFQAALETFQKLIQECPYDHRGWWGLIKAKTEDFESYMNHSSDFNEICDLYVNVSKTADSDSLVKIGVLFEEYEQRWNKHYDELTRKKTSELFRCEKEYNQKIKKIKNNIKKINIEKNKVDDNYGKTETKVTVLCIVAFLGLILYGLIEASSIGNFFLGMFIYGGVIGFVFNLIKDGIDSSYRSELAKLSSKQSSLESEIKQLKIKCDDKKREIERKYPWLRKSQ
ncbi:MAG: hypothetical protein K2N89_06810 [Lachnospiraceae bacterium]|nr:hypothetical protein [Lachnospiraceae bacterium]